MILNTPSPLPPVSLPIVKYIIKFFRNLSILLITFILWGIIEGQKEIILKLFLFKVLFYGIFGFLNCSIMPFNLSIL
jgi:hypothetical protein